MIMFKIRQQAQRLLTNIIQIASKVSGSWHLPEPEFLILEQDNDSTIKINYNLLTLFKLLLAFGPKRSMRSVASSKPIAVIKRTSRTGTNAVVKRFRNPIAKQKFPSQLRNSKHTQPVSRVHNIKYDVQVKLNTTKQQSLHLLSIYAERTKWVVT